MAAPKPRSDRELVRLAVDGDHGAYAELVARYDALVHGIALHHGMHAEVDDVVQETFLSAWTALRSLRQRGQFGAWVGQVARNTCLSFRRRRRRRAAVEQTAGTHDPPAALLQPDEVSEADQRAQLLDVALRQLTPEHRLLVLLYHVEGCTYRQISRGLGIPLATVRWRMMAAMRRLRRLLPGELALAGQRIRPGRAARVAGVLAAMAAGESAARIPVPVPAPPWRLPLRPLHAGVTLSVLLHVLVLRLGTPDRQTTSGIAAAYRPAPAAHRWATTRSGAGPQTAAVRGRTGPGAARLDPPPLPDLDAPPPTTTGPQPRSSFREPRRADGHALLRDLARRNLALLEQERQPPPEDGTFDGLDLLRIEDIDRAGSRHGLALVDPVDRRRLRGFVHFAGPAAFGGTAGYSYLGQSLELLSIFLRRETHLNARIYGGNEWNHTRRDELLEFPILFSAPASGIFVHSFAWWDPVRLDRPLSATDARFVGTYLRRGGFLFLEGYPHYLRTFVEAMRDEFGDEARLLRVPFDHEIYHSYYDFRAGFPGEVRSLSPTRAGDDPWDFPTPGVLYSIYDNALWGVEWRGELIAVMSGQRILSLSPPVPVDARWSNWYRGDSWNLGMPGGYDVVTPWLRAATNIVVYALTRPSSHARQKEPWLWDQLARAGRSGP